jgi:hypothetical protein
MLVMSSGVGAIAANWSHQQSSDCDSGAISRAP